MAVDEHLGIPAQVYVVVDSDGRLHPGRVRFKDENGVLQSFRIVGTIKLETMERSPEIIEFVCKSIQYNRVIHFMLIYHIRHHRWFLRMH